MPELMQWIVFGVVILTFVTASIVAVLGITKKLDIDKIYLVPLLSGILLIPGAVVTNWSDFSFLGKEKNVLPKESADMPDVFLYQQDVPAYMHHMGAEDIVRIIEEYEAIIQEPAASADENVSDVQEHFMFKIASLDAEIQKLGKYINFKYRPSEKKRRCHYAFWCIGTR